MENKVKLLEKYNKELENKIEKSMSEKFEEIEGKRHRLEVQKELVQLLLKTLYLLKITTELANLMTLNVLFVRNILEIQHF